MNKKSLVIIGSGMASGRLLDEMLKRDRATWQITVVGDEPWGSYNRIMLSAVLAEEIEQAAIISKPPHWFVDNDVNFVGSTRVQAIDRQRMELVTDRGDRIAYDELVIATGSCAARIPAKNQTLRNICSFRTIDDTQRISSICTASLSEKPAALVIGGGLLGLEAAWGIAKKGIPVTVIHRNNSLLNRQLDSMASVYLNKLMSHKNIDCILNDEVVEFTGSHKVDGAILKSGRRLDCTMAVIATGIKPNKELGLQAGLAGTRGIAVDEFMQTSDENISALGECVEHNSVTYGLVEPIWRQCGTLADRLCGNRLMPYAEQPIATKLKVSGVNLFSAGEVVTRPHHRELLVTDPANSVYRKLLLEGNRIVGIVLLGDTRGGAGYFNLMQRRQDVSACLMSLALGQTVIDTASELSSAA